jgi:hypothetical protein
MNEKGTDNLSLYAADRHGRRRTGNTVDEIEKNIGAAIELQAA